MKTFTSLFEVLTVDSRMHGSVKRDNCKLSLYGNMPGQLKSKSKLAELYKKSIFIIFFAREQ